MCLGFLDDTRVTTLARQELDVASSERRAWLDPVGGIQREVPSVGMAIVRDTNLQGISAIAVPISDFTERVRAILTVLGTTGSFDTAADGDVVKLMLEMAESISTSLGHSKNP